LKLIEITLNVAGILVLDCTINLLLME